jgi:hypothetical protein
MSLRLILRLISPLDSRGGVVSLAATISSLYGFSRNLCSNALRSTLLFAFNGNSSMQ